MPWQAIARKEIRGLVKPRSIKLGLVLVGVTFTMGGYLLPTAQASPTTTDYTGYMQGAVTLLLPLFGLLLGYKTVVAERESGQLELLLSLPHSRKGTVFGKFVGRTAVLAMVVGLGILSGSALVAYPFGRLEPLVMVGYFLITGLYGMAFVSIGMAISTMTTSSRLATAATFGVFFLFVVLWPELEVPLFLALEYLGLANGGLPDWALFVRGLEPGLLYDRIIAAFFGQVDRGRYLGPDAPWFLGEWPALVLLGAWTIGPVAVGYRRFRGTDL